MMATSPISKHEMQVEVNCDTCENTAKHVCKTCHDRLCDRCKIIHSRSKASYDHDVVLLTYEILTLITDSSLECPSYQDCKWHPKFKANVACEKCEVPVCEKCLIGNHNGHSLKDINEMFKGKKEKLEQKVLRFRSGIPKYKSNLEEMKRKQEEILENRDAVKKEIVSHFENVVSTLEASKEMLLNTADKMAQTSVNAITNHQQKLLSYIQNMQKLANSIQNEDLRKRIAFIFYENCSDDYLSEPLSFPSPGMLKYSEAIVCEQSPQSLGRVTQNLKLRETKGVRLQRVLFREQRGALVYSLKSGAFWLSLSEAKSYIDTKTSEEGDCLVINEIKVNELNSRSKVRCTIVDNDTVVYTNDSHRLSLYRLQDSQKNLFVNFASMIVVCLSLTKDGELLIVLEHSREMYSGIARFNLRGKCKQYLTHMVKKTAEPILPGKNNFRAYIAENINGDICLSFDSENRKVAQAAVIIMRPNGVHRVTYQGQQSSKGLYAMSWDSRGLSSFQSFQPRGICTNVYGHILVADESNRGIHILDEDGGFLTMLTIPNEPEVVPISLCVDNKNNLCIGCDDEKIRILQYLDLFFS